MHWIFNSVYIRLQYLKNSRKSLFFFRLNCKKTLRIVDCLKWQHVKSEWGTVSQCVWDRVYLPNAWKWQLFDIGSHYIRAKYTRLKKTKTKLMTRNQLKAGTHQDRRRATVGLVCLVCSTRQLSLGSHRRQFAASGMSGPSAKGRTLIGCSV